MVRKLKTIMVVCFVLVNALILACVSYLSYSYFFKFTTEEISQSRIALLNESANKLSGFTRNISEAGKFIAIDRSVIQLFSEEYDNPYDALVKRDELQQIVRDVSSLKREIDSIEVYTDWFSQYPYLYKDTIYPEVELEEFHWFQSFIASVDNGWAPEHMDPHTGKDVISYIHRVMDARNRTVGYIKVNVKSSQFLGFLRDMNLYEEINEPFILLNTGGTVIAETHSRHDFPMVNELLTKSDDRMFERLIPKYDKLTNYHEVVKTNNDHYMLLLSKPNHEQWRLAQIIMLDELYRDTNQLRVFIIIIGSVAIVLSIPIVYSIGRWITKPVTEMIRAMRKVEKGHFNVELKEHYIEEYDILTDNFNQMTKELDKLVKQVEEENTNRREAELRALQSQIMPHFLYNTLDMIKWKSMDHDVDNVENMVNNLSKMLRIGLSGGLNFIQLREELEHARSFVDIQKQRLTQKIEYKVRVPAKLKDLYVPKIIIQPFIENSLKHGYSLTDTENIHLHVHANIEEHQEILVLQIEDQGTGIPNDWSIEQSSGIGIKNVRERISLYCGEDYDVHVTNKEEGGVRVTIKLPIYEENPMMMQKDSKDKDILDSNSN